MAPTLAGSTLRTPANAFLAPSDDVRIDPNSVAGMRALVRRVMAETGLSQKAFAIDAGCSPSELSDALNGKENRRFEAEWIYRQNALFLRRFLDALAEERQVTREHARTATRRRIVELLDLLLAEVA
jgi:transcriptional regulator with XRE-family HTH domain